MCHKDRRDAGYRMWVYLRSGWESMIELNDIQVYCTYTSWKCGFPFHLHHFYLPFLPLVPQPDNENHSFFLFIAVFVQSIITARINCFLLLFPLLLYLFFHSLLNMWLIRPGNHLATDKYPRGICGSSEVSKTSEWKPSSVPSHPLRVV